MERIHELEEDQSSMYNVGDEEMEDSTTGVLLNPFEGDPVDSWDEESLHKESDRLRLSKWKAAAVRIVSETDSELKRNSSAFQFAVEDHVSSTVKKSHGTYGTLI